MVAVRRRTLYKSFTILIPVLGYYGENETDKERAPLVTSGPQQTIIIPSGSIVWGRYPLQTVCGNCGNAILTEIEHVAGR